jgi:integral membrane protein
VQKLFGAYRVLALIVGILLTFNAFVVFPLDHFLTEGTRLQKLGADLSFMWVIHGWFYMAYFVVSFLLARRLRWSIQFTVLMFVAGLVPLLIFWVERVVVRKVRVESPETVSA